MRLPEENDKRVITLIPTEAMNDAAAQNLEDLRNSSQEKMNAWLRLRKEDEKASEEREEKALISLTNPFRIWDHRIIEGVATARIRRQRRLSATYQEHRHNVRELAAALYAETMPKRLERMKKIHPVKAALLTFKHELLGWLRVTQYKQPNRLPAIQPSTNTAPLSALQS